VNKKLPQELRQKMAAEEMIQSRDFFIWISDIQF
jgi:hypothetical protein